MVSPPDAGGRGQDTSAHRRQRYRASFAEKASWRTSRGQSGAQIEQRHDGGFVAALPLKFDLIVENSEIAGFLSRGFINRARRRTRLTVMAEVGNCVLELSLGVVRASLRLGVPLIELRILHAASGFEVALGSYRSFTNLRDRNGVTRRGKLLVVRNLGASRLSILLRFPALVFAVALFLGDEIWEIHELADLAGDAHPRFDERSVGVALPPSGIEIGRGVRDDLGIALEHVALKPEPVVARRKIGGAADAV
jgi:hypothetical protein